ncbi:MAG: aminotransferase class III-fold pyridoxal phosphate-dependent enzyme, partial [Chloroflexi bacterium]|nr:aminotransferase class III-fold pyridoxal phosphate-dependent enzyme [Chloroflexota bacterium]
AARAFTGKEKIAKFEGGYHGAHDDVAVSVDPPLSKAGDARAPNSVADYLGVPRKSPEHTIVMPYNDIEASAAIIEKHKDELAAVIVEPVIWRLGMVPADIEFLKGLRDITRRLGIVLIFDEVIALRVARGGAQERFGVTPDMTAMGKIIGGGLPVGGFGGRSDIMELFSPKSGPKVKHAGTFNGNPMTAVAGVATLEALTPEVYRRLDEMGDLVRKKLSDLIRDREAPMGVTGVSSLFALQFTTAAIRDFRAVQTNDKTFQRLMFIGLLNEGFALSPACAGNVSTAVRAKDVDGFVAAVGRVLSRAGYA